MKVGRPRECLCVPVPAGASPEWVPGGHSARLFCAVIGRVGARIWEPQSIPGGEHAVSAALKLEGASWLHITPPPRGQPS